MSSSIGVHTLAGNLNPNTTYLSGNVTTTTGSLLVAVMGYQAGQFSSFDDNKGNTWTAMATTFPGAGELLFGSGANGSRAFWTVGGTRGATHNFTMHLSAAVYGLLFVCEFLNTSGTMDDAQRIDDATSAYSTPSCTASVNDGVLMCAGLVDGSGGPETDTWGGAFVSGDRIEQQTNGADMTGSMAAKVISATGGYIGSETIAGMTVNDVAMWGFIVKGVSSGTPIQILGKRLWINP